MKKLTILFISLVLVCTSVFAGFSFTVGAGYATKVPNYDDYEIINGPALLFGVDYEIEEDISLYADIELAYVTINPNEVKTASGCFYNIEAAAGAGYTFHIKDWSLMVGAGLELQKFFDEEQKNQEVRLGLDSRLKATLNCNERFGVSIQINPSYDFTTSSTFKTIDGAEYACNFLAGFTFKY